MLVIDPPSGEAASEEEEEGEDRRQRSMLLKPIRSRGDTNADEDDNTFPLMSLSPTRWKICRVRRDHTHNERRILTTMSWPDDDDHQLPPSFDADEPRRRDRFSSSDAVKATRLASSHLLLFAMPSPLSASLAALW